MRILLLILLVASIVSCASPKEVLKPSAYTNDYDAYNATHKSLIDLEGYKLIDGDLIPEEVSIAVLDTTSILDKIF